MADWPRRPTILIPPALQIRCAVHVGMDLVAATAAGEARLALPVRAVDIAAGGVRAGLRGIGRVHLGEGDPVAVLEVADDLAARAREETVQPAGEARSGEVELLDDEMRGLLHSDDPFKTRLISVCRKLRKASTRSR